MHTVHIEAVLACTNVNVEIYLARHTTLESLKKSTTSYVLEHAADAATDFPSKGTIHAGDLNSVTYTRRRKNTVCDDNTSASTFRSKSRQAARQ